MILKTERKTLKENLEIVNKALGKNDSEPICTHFLFRVGPDYCEILAGGKGSLCGYLKVEGLPATGVEDGKKVEFTAEGGRLMGFLGDLPDCTIDIVYDATTKQVNLRPDTVKVNFNLVSLLPKDYPDFETDYKAAYAAGKKGDLDVEVLSEAVGFAKQFVGDNPTNPGLSLVRMRADGTLNSGDGKSIAIYKSSGFSGEFKLRQTILDGVMSFVGKSTGTLALYEGGNHYFFVNSQGFYFGFSKVGFDIPAAGVPDVFSDTAGDNIFEVDREKLAGAIKRLKWSLDSDLKRMGFKIEGDGVDATLTVTAKDTNGATSEETVSGVLRTKGSGECKFFLNYENVFKGLGHFTKPNVHFCINSTGFHYAKMVEFTKFSDAIVAPTPAAGATTPVAPAATSDDITRVLILSLIRKDR